MFSYRNKQWTGKQWERNWREKEQNRTNADWSWRIKETSQKENRGKRAAVLQKKTS